MSQLIIDLNPQSFDIPGGQDGIEAALGQLMVQLGLKYRGIRTHGERAYLDFDDSENAKRAFQGMSGMRFEILSKYSFCTAYFI